MNKTSNLRALSYTSFLEGRISLINYVLKNMNEKQWESAKLNHFYNPKRDLANDKYQIANEINRLKRGLFPQNPNCLIYKYPLSITLEILLEDDGPKEKPCIKAYLDVLYQNALVKEKLEIK